MFVLPLCIQNLFCSVIVHVLLLRLIKFVYVIIIHYYLQSLDYDTCENHLLLDEERKRGYPFYVWKDIARWFIILLIGVVTALIAFFIDICIEEFSKIKYRELKKCILYLKKNIVVYNSHHNYDQQPLTVLDISFLKGRVWAFYTILAKCVCGIGFIFQVVILVTYGMNSVPILSTQRV